MSRRNSDKPERVIHPVPPVVIGLTLLIVGIEAIFQLAEAGLIGGPRAVGWRIATIEAYGFSPAILDLVLVNGDYSPGTLIRFITYPFLNMQLMAVAFSAALTLALGKFSVGFFGGFRLLVIYLFTSVAGAIVFALVVEGRDPLIGGFTPVFGLIGAYSYTLWLDLGKAGKNQIMAFRLIGFLMLFQLVRGLIFGGNNQWIAELAGFAAGFLIAVVLAPGGWSTLLARLRQRS